MGMIKNKLTNEIYENRKVAKQRMGHANFNRALKNGDIEIIVYKETDIII